MLWAFPLRKNINSAVSLKSNRDLALHSSKVTLDGPTRRDEVAIYVDFAAIAVFLSLEKALRMAGKQKSAA